MTIYIQDETEVYAVIASALADTPKGVGADLLGVVYRPEGEDLWTTAIRVRVHLTDDKYWYTRNEDTDPAEALLQMRKLADRLKVEDPENWRLVNQRGADAFMKALRDLGAQLTTRTVQ